MRLSERCSCGSNFSAAGMPLTEAKRLLREWRRRHECSAVEGEVAMVASTTNGVFDLSGNVMGFVARPSDLDGDED